MFKSYVVYLKPKLNNHYNHLYMKFSKPPDFYIYFLPTFLFWWNILHSGTLRKVHKSLRFFSLSKLCFFLLLQYKGGILFVSLVSFKDYLNTIWVVLFSIFLFLLLLINIEIQMIIVFRSFHSKLTGQLPSQDNSSLVRVTAP